MLKNEFVKKKYWGSNCKKPKYLSVHCYSEMTRSFSKPYGLKTTMFLVY
jgi:hypothetical protein